MQTSIPLEHAPRTSARDIPITAADGFVLAASRFDPPPDAPALPPVVIAAATAVRRGYYAKFARFLAAQGHPVLTFDYRGIGGSVPRGPDQEDMRMHQWGQLDLDAAIQALRLEFPDAPPLMVGHSVGGQILPLAERAADLAGLLLVASQSGAPRHWQGRNRLKMIVTWHLIGPALTCLYGYLPGYVLGGEPLPKGIVQEWMRWGRHPDYILGYFPELLQRFRALSFPLRLYSFTDDFYGPKAAVDELFGWYGGHAKERRHLSPADVGVRRIGHFGFFRDSFAPTLWAEAAAWLRKAGDESASRTGPASSLGASPEGRDGGDGPLTADAGGRTLAAP